MLESPSHFEEDGMRTMAGAICCLAAGAHSKDAAEQIQMANSFYEAAISGFLDIPSNAVFDAWVLEFIQSAKKKSK